MSSSAAGEVGGDDGSGGRVEVSDGVSASASASASPSKSVDAVESPETRKRKAEDRRTRKNKREKERRTEINNLFNTMVDEFNVPKELKADKNAILRAAVAAIKKAQEDVGDASKIKSIIGREVKESKNRHHIVKASDSEMAVQIITSDLVDNRNTNNNKESGAAKE